MRAIVLSLLLAATAQAETATEALKARDAEIRAALPPQGSEPTPATRQKLEGIVTRAVDLEGMAKSALGKTWTETPPAKRKKFLDAFKGRFRKATGEQLDQYRSTSIKYLPEKTEDEDTIVPTEVLVKGEPTRIDYRMRQNSGSWRIVDIVVDDVSTVENYRSSFNRIIKKEGMDGLIARLNGTGKVVEPGGSKGSSR
ncbi:MAG TPA: ABC transporter substrate-binding protein [Candidatus Polarisedimenticolaceae bacterium]|nr:ABC transporter substrate-binding protein [Candidatus Polarisedimenticolaceae bacterium]